MIGRNDRVIVEALEAMAQAMVQVNATLLVNQNNNQNDRWFMEWEWFKGTIRLCSKEVMIMKVLRLCFRILRIFSKLWPSL